MLTRRRIRLRKAPKTHHNIRRVIARVTRHRKILRRTRSFFLICEQL